MADGAALTVRQSVVEAGPLFLLFAAFYSWLSVRDEYIGNISDSGIYLTVADYFSPYRAPLRDLGASMFFDFSFPPLYPLMLALMGGGSEHPVASYVATSCMTAAAVCAVYLWLRVQRLSLAEALAITAIFALLPATLLTAISIQSEPLYAAMVFAGFALWRVERNAPAANACAAILIGMSTLARTVGVTAVAALLIEWMSTERRRRLTIPVLALGPIVAWTLVKYVNGIERSYLEAVERNSTAETIAYLADQLAINLPAVGFGLVSGFDLIGAPHAKYAVGLLSLLFLVGWASRLRRFHIDSVYLILYLAIIALWPYPNHMRRFLQVLLPIFLLYSYVGVNCVICFFAPSLERAAAMAYVAIALLVLAPSTSVMVGQIIAAEGTEAENFVRSPQWYMYDTPLRATAVMNGVTRVLDGMRGIDEHLPADACVSSPAFAYIPLYGRRRGRPPADVAADDEHFFKRLRECPYVFMMAAAQWPSQGYPPMYPYERIKDRLEVVEVSMWDRNATKGDVLTMLGRVRFEADEPVLD
jgi:hypothetical protein